ncbi:hypothetical protein [Candidatus Protochlamydia sp. W-9]|uniref:hypothetical protein n=1 Tax=Candidatus Protochlamydia sp. W-9 TaxID=1785087 RepID=UPI00096AA7DA|nr:hypothetical protein [Candidatus Protochlamydia sp. W-9]
MKNKNALLVSCTLITFVAIGNLIRLFWDISLSIGPLELPGWTGAIGFLLFGILAAWSFQELYALNHLIKFLNQQRKQELLQLPELPIEHIQNPIIEDLPHNIQQESNKI